MANPMRTFASDNYAGVLPEIMSALTEEAQSGRHARAYGHDNVTNEARLLIHEIFNSSPDDPLPGVHFVFNGTGANILSIMACTHSYHAVICSDISHIICDESSSPETVTGVRLISIPTDENGKINVDIIEEKLDRIGDMHAAQPKMITIAQPTEYGTVYTIDELKQISNLAKKHNLYFHVDGARLFNAASSLNCTLRDITTAVGVDILSLGGTKAGLMYGEAVIIFNQSLLKSDDGQDNSLKYRHKQVMQLASKQRFIAIQFLTLLKNDFWKKSSEHSNGMAQLLKKRLESLPKKNDKPLIRITRPVETNAIFLEIPRDWYKPLSELFPFYMWRTKTSEVRLMCSFDTTENDIDRFINKMNELIQN
ncbi:unnamed protein product [Rotaria socialis]|uniref:Aromatic amino acid beta-eliminating lyase/threonine aldolase domain-containing protein n=1 Tax=Rotaria socialis TaxID=392032 RepID=A0A820DIR8_9BILA|nr:unnamed protein product [Rotaria socialis]CAF3380208.1 unnamed protein product [Rotaria socialis]CAF3425353.1 unnamed protein product [Rotaria socialis]CAF3474162.1 unnamed protein product [Rotaria socialis]CAF4125018.1 unnamed protein product [Rotaria socialis]